MKDLQSRARILPVALASLVMASAFGNLATAQSPPPVQAPAQQALQHAQTGAALLEKNTGQWDSHVLFRIRAGGVDTFIAKTGFAIVQAHAPHDAPGNATRWATMMSFVGSNPAPLVSTDSADTYHTNYLIGKQNQWHTNVPTYRQVTLTGVYPGIDLVYHTVPAGGLKYDFIVHPGANPGQIQQRYAGHANITIDSNGALVLRTGLGNITQDAPLTHQADGTSVSDHYALAQDGTVSYVVGAHDAAQDLVIDPLTYSTYLGGFSNDQGNAIAVDSSGNAYIAGYTLSNDYPTTTGAYQTSYGGGRDAFVTKLNSAGTALVYSTYLGGPGGQVNGIALDGSGNVYVTGSTTSTSFPTTAGAYQTTSNAADAFVTKLNSDGTALVYSTYLGGTGTDHGNAIAIDASGNAYVTGDTTSTNFPTTAGAFQTTFGGNSFMDVFVTKLNSAGSALAYSTYVAGSNTDEALGIAVDSSGNAYITGDTISTNYPTTAGAYQTMKAVGTTDDAFVTKLNGAGTALVYSTYLGGASSDGGNAIAVDASGSVFVAGSTASINYPTTVGAYQITKGTGALTPDAFVTKLNSAGTALVYSTYIGGGNTDEALGIAVDVSGSAFVVGDTSSTPYPVTTDAAQSTKPGAVDAFLSRLDPSGATLVYSTYLGGSAGTDGALAVQIDSASNAYVTGYTSSSNYPTTAGAYQTTISSGNFEAFVTKVPTPAPPTAPQGLGSSCGNPGTVLSWSAPASDGTRTIQNYKVYRSDGTTYNLLSSPTATTYTDVPTWQAAAYPYQVTAVNTIGEGPAASVSAAPCDSQAATVSGNPVAYAWTNTIPTLAGVGWQDTYSGLQNNAQYSIGTTSGGTDVLGWTAMPTQPTTGQTTTWTPSWSPSSLAQGLNYVNTRVNDRAGNQLQTNGAYTVQYQTNAPAISGAPNTLPWNTLTGSGVSWQDTASGLQNNAQSSIGSSSGGTDRQAWTSLQVQPTSGQTTPWSPTLTFPSGLPQGLSYVSTRINNVASNQLTTNGAFIIRIDTVAPTIAGAPHAVTWTNAVPTLSGVTWQDPTSGLQSTVQYGLGSTSGATDIANWANLPSQPTAGQTTAWTPSWSPTGLAQGLTYVNTRVTDAAGNQLTTNGAYTVQYDSVLPTSSGAPWTLGWTNANPTMSTVCIQDATSGLASTVTYKVGSAVGASDYQASTALPVQPTAGQTSWCPSFQISSSTWHQGDNYLTIHVVDLAGNALDVPAYRVRWDTVLPAASGAPQAYTWRNTMPTVSGVTWTDATAGLASVQWSIGTTTGGTEVMPWVTMAPQPTAGQTSWSPSFTPPVLAQGLNHINVRVFDQAGNTLTTNDAYTVQYDTANPITTGAPQSLGWHATIPALAGVTWTDSTAGLLNAQYSIGSTSGATDVAAWASTPVQPSSGQSSWSPSWSPSTLVQGMNYVNTRVTDRASNTLTTSGAYIVGYDTQAPTATSAPSVIAWTNDATMSGACIQDSASGLASATYTVGSTSGGSDYQAATSVPTQPTAGQASWCPSFTAAGLHQGLNYVGLHVVDQAGNAADFQAYQVSYDNVADTVASPTARNGAGGPTLPLNTWQTVNTPRFEWTTPSSTSPITGYSYTLTTTNTAPDASVDTTSLFLDRAGSPLADGTWYFSVRSVDAAGNGGVIATVIFLVDTTSSSITILSSPTHPFTSTYYSSPTATFTWTSHAGASGIQGYAYDLVTGSPGSLHSTLDATGTATSATLPVSGLQDYTFRIKLQDGTGAWSPVSTLAIKVNTLPPTITSLTPLPASDSTDAVQVIQATFNDQKAGADPTEAATHVDPGAVHLFVDNLDVVAFWRAQAVCQNATPLCPIEVDTHHVQYKPPTVLLPGNHNLTLSISDTSIPGVSATASWNFTENKQAAQFVAFAPCSSGSSGENVNGIAVCGGIPVSACPRGHVGLRISDTSLCIPLPTWCPNQVGANISSIPVCVPVCPSNPDTLVLAVCVPVLSACPSEMFGVTVNGYTFTCIIPCPLGPSACLPAIPIGPCPGGLVGEVLATVELCITTSPASFDSCPDGSEGASVAEQDICIPVPPN